MFVELTESRRTTRTRLSTFTCKILSFALPPPNCFVAFCHNPYLSELLMKPRQILAALLMLTLPSLVLAEGWVTDPNTGCEIWTDSADAASWNGACVGGKASGNGIITYKKNGKLFSTYKGEVEDGKLNGLGVYLWASGSRYEGQCKDDKRNGQGVYLWESGSRYEGAWRNDQRHGLGRQTNADGSLYHEGQWANGQPVRVAAAPEPARASSSTSDNAEAENRSRNRNACLNQCDATKSNMQAICAGMSDEAKYGIFDSSPRNQCQMKIYDAERHCQSACRNL